MNVAADEFRSDSAPPHDLVQQGHSGIGVDGVGDEVR